MRNLHKLSLILPISVFGLCILTRIGKSHPKTKVVCRLDKRWEETSEAVKNFTKTLVWKHYPYAQYKTFTRSSEIRIVKDNRNEAMARKGYFVIGYDNMGNTISIPNGYDFYVKFSGD